MISQTDKWLVPLASRPNEGFIALLDQVNIGSHQRQTSKVREAKLYALITLLANKEGVSAQDRNTMHILGYEFLYGTNAVLTSNPDYIICCCQANEILSLSDPAGITLSPDEASTSQHIYAILSHLARRMSDLLTEVGLR